MWYGMGPPENGETVVDLAWIFLKSNLLNIRNMGYVVFVYFDVRIGRARAVF